MRKLKNYFAIIVVITITTSVQLKASSISFYTDSISLYPSLWEVDTVKLYSDLTIPSGFTLNIAPGTVVEFQGYYSLFIEGNVHAEGNANNQILFTINDTTGFTNFNCTQGGWKTLESRGLHNHNRFTYCIFEYAKNLDPNSSAIVPNTSDYHSKFVKCIVRNNYAQNVALLTYSISDCIVSDNYCNGVKAKAFRSEIHRNRGHGIIISRLYESAEDFICSVFKCNISFNQGYGICEVLSDPHDIYCNQINNNWGGIYLKSNHANIDRCKITNNSVYGAIYLDTASSTITNCLIDNNSIISDSLPINAQSVINVIESFAAIRYNTIVNNKAVRGGGVSSINSILYSSNNIFWNNEASESGSNIYAVTNKNKILEVHTSLLMDSISSISINGDFSLNINNIMAEDPLFVDLENRNFILSPASPCINAGIIDMQYNLGLYGTIDLSGKDRLYSFTMDMGAYEYYPDTLFFTRQPESIYECTGFSDTSYFYFQANDVFEAYRVKNGSIFMKDRYNRITDTVFNLAIRDTGIYQLCITNYQDTIWSEEFQFKITDQVKIVNQSPSIILCEGEDTLLFASTNNATPAIFSWLNNKILIPEETDSTLHITANTEKIRHFQCVVTGLCNTDSSNMIEVVSIESPVITLPEVIELHEEEVFLLDPLGDFDRILWNNTIERQSYLVSDTGIVTVEVWDEYNCYNTDTIYVIAEIIDGLYNPIIHDIQYSIQPNPITSESIININDTESIILEITVISLSGKVVLHRNNINSNISKLSKTQLDAGYYIVRIHSSLGISFIPISVR